MYYTFISIIYFTYIKRKGVGEEKCVVWDDIENTLARETCKEHRRSIQDCGGCWCLDLYLNKRAALPMALGEIRVLGFRARSKQPVTFLGSYRRLRQQQLRMLEVVVFRSIVVNITQGFLFAGPVITTLLFNRHNRSMGLALLLWVRKSRNREVW